MEQIYTQGLLQMFYLVLKIQTFFKTVFTAPVERGFHHINLNL